MKKVFPLIFSGLVCFSFIFGLLFGEILCSEVQAEAPPQFAWMIPQSKWYFSSPTGIAVDGSGNVYVADTDNDRIQKFSSNGTFLTKWGSSGTGDGQFKSPRGIAIDGSDNVYVSDEQNCRIQKFSSNGTFLTKWGSSGSGDGQFQFPDGIAIDSSGNVYVADGANYRIQKFSSDGSFLAKWGSYGSGDGQFKDPTGIAIDGSGNVYVADGYYNDRIQKFSSNGTFLTKWGSYDPTGIAIDGSGNVYVADTYYSRIQKFSSNGTLLAQWETSVCGHFNSPGGIAIDGSGNVYVADTGNDRIQKFSSDRTFLAEWGSSGIEDGQFNDPTGIAIDGSGNVYVVDTGYSRIQKFNSDGTFLTKWGSSGSGDGQFYFAEGIAIDGSGNVYVADGNNDRIQKFSSDGTFLTKWGSHGTGNGQFNYPRGIAVDGSGNVYVTDENNCRVQKFSSNGTFLAKWGSYGSGDTQFHWPQSIAIDSSGNVYVTDGANYRIQKFSSDGTFLSKWGSYGSGDGQFHWPDGIAIDGSGNVYVADTDNDRIQKFSSDGTFLTKWGSSGSEGGQFRSPHGIAIDGSGDVYVTDTGYHRIQKFTYSSASAASFTVSIITGNTTEQGGQATFTISLDIQPQDNVTIALSSSDTQEGTVSPASLTFTPANWDSAQTVTVTGIDDCIDDGDTIFTIITDQAASSDQSYNGLDPQDVSVTNNDDDTANINISPTAGLFTRENPTDNTATFTVVLDTEPVAGVTINISSTDTQEGTVAPTSLTFTPTNWDSAQTVTVTGVDDFIDDGDTGYTITIEASSSDTTYNALSPYNVSVTNSDNDSANVTINPTGLTTSEAGTQQTFTVVLNTQPTADVTIALLSSDPQEGTILPQNLTFTNLNWNTLQEVTITPLNDDIDDGDLSYTIITSLSSSDAKYSPLDPTDVSVTNTDDDTAGISVNPTAELTTSEQGAQDTFTVVLGSEPTGDVTITINPDATEGTVFPENPIFTPADWDTPQTITVTGVDDDDDDCNQVYTIILTPASFDLTYSGLTPPNVTVTNLDNDVSSDAGPDQTVDEGNTVTLNGANSSSCTDVTYRWEKISGPSITLADPNSAVTSFVPPPVDPNESISFTFQLAVEKSIGVDVLDDVVITVNDNGINDFPADVIAMNCSVEEKTIGVKADSGDIISLHAKDPVTIAATEGMPQNLIYGLVDMHIKVNPGDTITVTIYLPEPAPEGYTWYKYSAQAGWQDYSDNAVFNNDRTQITLTVTDGGIGDSDGVADGVITDPSGLGTPSPTPSSGTPTTDAGAGGGGGGCFISDLVFGFFKKQ